jgi:hypothetical protein
MNPLTKWVIVGIIGLAVLATAGWIFYAGLIRPTTKPNPSTRQEGARDNYSTTISPKQTFGCMNFKIPKHEISK